jgi:putative transposase
MAKRHRAGGYPTDLTDEPWAVLAPLVARPAGPGRPPTVSLRAALNALLYLARAGCPWRLLPRESPHWTAVRYYFDKWAADGTWEEANGRLVEQTRERRGRAAQPTAALIDSQSSKTTEAGGERGFDGGKKINGRKRHYLVDTEGHLLAVLVEAADRTDRGGCFARLTSGGRRCRRIWADHAYNGDLAAWLRAAYGVDLAVVEHAPGQKGVAVLPRRWVVERTIAWLGRNRRLSKDYERSGAAMETWCCLASISLLLRRLRPDPQAERPYWRKAA